MKTINQTKPKNRHLFVADRLKNTPVLQIKLNFLRFAVTRAVSTRSNEACWLFQPCVDWSLSRLICELTGHDTDILSWEEAGDFEPEAGEMEKNKTK